jgi:hypothetical protein
MNSSVPHNVADECPMCLDNVFLQELPCRLCVVCNNLLHINCMRSVTNQRCIFCRTSYILARPYVARTPTTPDDFEQLYRTMLAESRESCLSRIKGTAIDILLTLSIFHAKQLLHMEHFRTVPELADRASLLIGTLCNKSRLISFIFSSNKARLLAFC